MINLVQVECLLNTYPDIIQISKTMFDLIFPDTAIPTFVKANFKGFTESKKSFESKIYFYIREKTISDCPDNVLHYLMECSVFKCNLNHVDMESFFRKVFLCDKTTDEIQITFF
jgi:hypothetical protein